ncbi:hypothetical protein GYMLUDRAFT_273348 [Collybiopsis luxurians FD-317 M1]|nr:hypothetical protein GYMLUDRAFT_273348 [Collybiopsis luxurians FD-317 M1]
MKLSSSSSLVFATLAISSSSSTLSALAAPAGDPAQAHSGVSAPNNNFNAARRGSISFPRAQDDIQEAPFQEQDRAVEKRDPIGSICALLTSLPLGPLVSPLLCPPDKSIDTASADSLAMFDQSSPSDTSSDQTSAFSASVSPSSSSSSACNMPTQPPSRRGVSQHPEAVPDAAAGVVGSTPAGGEAASSPVNPNDLSNTAKPVKSHSGDATQSAGQAPSKVVNQVPKSIKDEAGKAKGELPQTAKGTAGKVGQVVSEQVPARRSHRARRDVPPSASTSSSVHPPAQPPVQPPVQSPVQPSASTTDTSTVAEPTTPTSA